MSLLRINYKILTAWRKPDVDDYDNRASDYIFMKKFKGLIQYPTGQYYSKLLNDCDKETFRMSGILFAPTSVRFEDKMILRNIDGRAYAFYSVIPINENMGSIRNIGKVTHNEYRIEFLNENIELPTSAIPPIEETTEDVEDPEGATNG